MSNNMMVYVHLKLAPASDPHVNKRQVSGRKNQHMRGCRYK